MNRSESFETTYKFIDSFATVELRRIVRRRDIMWMNLWDLLDLLWFVQKRFMWSSRSRTIHLMNFWKSELFTKYSLIQSHQIIREPLIPSIFWKYHSRTIHWFDHIVSSSRLGNDSFDQFFEKVVHERFTVLIVSSSHSKTTHFINLWMSRSRTIHWLIHTQSYQVVPEWFISSIFCRIIHKHLFNYIVWSSRSRMIRFFDYIKSFVNDSFHQFFSRVIYKQCTDSIVPYDQVVHKRFTFLIISSRSRTIYLINFSKVSFMNDSQIQSYHLVVRERFSSSMFERVVHERFINSIV